jgi:single-stranded-DNA-specific exonuclease
MSNPCPIFLYNDLKVVDCKGVGEDKHIKLRMEDQDLYIDAIGFNFGEILSKINIFDKVDVACNIEMNVWNGQEKLQLNIKDIKTSDNIIFKEKYYSTLENCIINELDESEDSVLKKVNVYSGDLLSLIENDKRNVLLINTLDGAKSFIDTMKKMTPEIKEKIKLFYNNSVNSKYLKNIAIINPYLQNIKLEDFDNVVMYDLCFNKKQFDYIISNNKNVYIMSQFLNGENNINVFQNIIPKRDELIKVYQYIKSRSENQIINDDIFSLAREISVSYNIDINSLKLKKVLEVFEEMRLIKLETENNLYTIQLVKQNGNKVNINEADGLLKLQRIKDEFNYFFTYLNEAKIH